MEKITKGLAIEELEGQRARLLPDRIEMRKHKSGWRRRRSDGRHISALGLVEKDRFGNVTVF
jgi:hypothetical protein